MYLITKIENILNPELLKNILENHLKIFNEILKTN